MTPAATVATSYLVGNLHCPSCVAVIKNALGQEYAGRVFWVSPNIVTSVVTVEHEDGGAGLIRSMGKTLEDVGFEICAVDTTASIPDDFNASAADAEHARRTRASQESRRSRSSGGALDLWWSIWASRSPPATPHDGKAAAHLDNCEACKSLAAAVAHDNGRSLALEEQLHVASVSPGHLQQKLGAAAATGEPSPLERVVIDNDDAETSPALFRVTISIGGMTCASCSNTITEEIQKYPWVSRIVVNLVTNSATVDIKEKDRAHEVVEAVEDLGYEAALDKVVNLEEQRQASADSREVEIQIDGIFCPKCPDRIGKTLRNLGSSRVDLLKLPSRDMPFVKVRYTPQAPTFTIRHILKAIEATDPSLEAEIYHPPTLEERSRAIRAKHQRELFWRMMLTLVMAVPSFVLGIVYMSLVSEDDNTKRFLMEPWASGLSRLQIILFVLATPVYFFAADIFHVRAIKELRAMWRPGSRTPLAERFYKFGSMNMLMSLGTTIAYVSSIAQMIAAAVRDDGPVPDHSFYFDSVVFLTLFLLAGRLIEAYSKSKTGDAVGALAKLRPSTALLLGQDPLQGETVTITPIDQLECNDVIRIPNGTSPAADGVLVSGESSFDESSLTGESRPIAKAPGDEVFAGTMNKGGPRYYSNHGDAREIHA